MPPSSGVDARDAEGQPVAVWLSGGCHAVQAVLETWRIDDEWWRQRPVSRVYYSLLLEDGKSVTAYQDLIGKRWCVQTYLSQGHNLTGQRQLSLMWASASVPRR